MTINLRQSEIDTILQALSLAYNTDYPKSDPYNAQYIRLAKKLGGSIL